MHVVYKERGTAVLHQGHEFEAFGEPQPLSFGPYTVLGELGCGGMGVVYRALDTRLHRQVAIKVLHRDLPVSGPRDRFLREARLVSSLNHPNICTVFDIGEQDGDPYLVMELLEGESIKERMERGPVPLEVIREVAFRVGLALQAAHGRGIVHRDIKPANLFLVRDGRGSLDVKVLDFGLAKLAGGDRSARGTVDDLTRVGATVGTVEYMSPEQACGEPLDARSDLFSLGAVLYEMATGSVPFRGATSAVIFSELLNRDPVPPREKNLHVPASLDAIIRGLLTKDRTRRLGSASAMLDALAAPSRESQAARSSRGVRVPRRPVRPVSGQPRANALQAANDVTGGGDHDRGNAGFALAGLPAEPTMDEPRNVVKPRGQLAATSEGAGQRDRARSTVATASTTNQDEVNTGWKVALAAGVIVAVLVTLLVILVLGSSSAKHLL